MPKSTPAHARTQVSPTAIQSRLSLLFFAIMFVMLGNQQAIPSVFEDRLLYYREKGAHVYGAYRYARAHASQSAAR